MKNLEKESRSEAYLRRDAEQRERLAALLSAQQFSHVADAPYTARLALEKWSLKEEERLSVWFDSYPPLASDEVAELAQMLNAPEPDAEPIAEWCEAHGVSAPISLLVQLFSEGKRIGISENMRQRGNAQHEKFRGAKAEAISIWSAEYKGKVSKNVAAKLLTDPIEEGGHGFNVKPRTAREWLMKC